MVSLRRIFIGFIALFVCVSGQVFRPGRCPTVRYVKPVDWYRMQGRWFFIERYPEYHPALHNLRCIFEVKSLNRNGTLSVFSSNLNTRTGEMTRDMFVLLIQPNPFNPSISTATGITDSLPDYTYYILDLDYDSHHLLYGCVDGGPHRNWSLEYLSILSRSNRPMTRSLRDRLYNRLGHNNINPVFLQRVDHRYCPKL